MKIPILLLFVSHGFNTISGFRHLSLFKTLTKKGFMNEKKGVFEMRTGVKKNILTSVTNTEIILNSESQKKYSNVLKNPEIPVVVGIGPAGSGKTHLACDAFVHFHERGIYNRLVLTRPSVKVEGEDLGFIPGSLHQKMDPWIQPIYEILGNYYTKGQLKKMIDSNSIEVVPLAYMRGRSFHKCFVLADEMQNATPTQLKMLLTRMGTDSKMVLTGDLEQSDLTTCVNGLHGFVQRYTEKPLKGAEMVKMDCEDIQRSQFVKDFIQWW